MQKFTQNDQNHEKIYAEWHNSHLYFAKIYSICVFPVRSPSVQNVCSVGWFVLYGFYGSYGYFYPSASVCFRVSPCSLFYSNTESHGFSRSLIHLHPSNPCDPWADLFCTDLMDTTDILFICIRVIRVIRWAVLFCTDSTDLTESLFICLRVFPCVPCSLFYSNTDFHGVSRNLCSSASV